MPRSHRYTLRKRSKVNYSAKKPQTTIKKKVTTKKGKTKNTTTTRKIPLKKPITVKNKKIIEENCNNKKQVLEEKLVQLFSKLNKQSLDSDLIAIGYLFNCLFTNNPESIQYDIEKIRKYINSKKSNGPKGNLLWENLKSLYFSAATF